MGTHPNLLSAARILLKWKSLIIILTVIAAIVSAVTAMMLPVYYKSKVTFYPQNLAAFDRGYLFGTESKEKVQSLFGDKQDVNRVLSIANSTELQGFIQAHFNLPEHYGIDTTSPSWRYKMNKAFEKNFKVIKSELDNVELTIWDRNPDMASEIANFYVAQIDAIYSGLLGDRNQKTYRQ
jgi:capsular polysaccharide biosynthesis protein